MKVWCWVKLSRISNSNAGGVIDHRGHTHLLQTSLCAHTLFLMHARTRTHFFTQGHMFGPRAPTKHTFELRECQSGAKQDRQGKKICLDIIVLRWEAHAFSHKHKLPLSSCVLPSTLLLTFVSHLLLRQKISQNVSDTVIHSWKRSCKDVSVCVTADGIEITRSKELYTDFCELIKCST